MPFVQRQQLTYRERNLATRNNGIAKAVLQQKLGALESLGQALVQLKEGVDHGLDVLDGRQAHHRANIHPAVIGL